MSFFLDAPFSQGLYGFFQGGVRSINRYQSLMIQIEENDEKGVGNCRGML